MADDRPKSPAEDLVFRRGKLRKRDDEAIDLFREALANLGDIPRVKRILLELGRFYNPVLNGPTLDLPTRRRVIELLESGRAEEAGHLLDDCLREYTRADSRP
ncbi:MAG: hypothetical protein ACRELA_21115 [Candidatus Rokuibacteriota bacterium]